MSQLEDWLLTQPPTKLPNDWPLVTGAATSTAEEVDIKNNGNPDALLGTSQHNEPDCKPHAQNCNDSASHEYPSFQTERKNVTIRVSEDNLSKARQLLSSTGNTDDLSTCAPTEINNGAMNSESSVERILPTFQTAGKNKTIQVSKESLLRANAIFSDVGDDSATVVPAVGENNPFLDIYTSLTRVCSNNKSCSNLVAKKATQSHPTFQTTGEKNTIIVSSKSQSKANALFSGLETKEANSSQYPIDYEVSNCLTDNDSNEPNSAHVPADQFNSGNVGERSSVQVQCQQFSAFQTAGKKQTIQISTESMAKANKLLSGSSAASCDQESSSGKLNYKSMNGIMASQGNNNHPQSTSQNIPLADEALDANDLITEKTQTILMSAESLSKVNGVFHGDQSSIQFGKELTCCGGPSSAATAAHTISDKNSKNQDTNPSTDDLIKPITIFQTTGKKQAISVSTENMSKVNDLFSRIDDKSFGKDIKPLDISADTSHKKDSPCASDTSICSSGRQTSSYVSEQDPNSLIIDSFTVNSCNSTPIKANTTNKYITRGTVVNPYTNRKPAALIPTKRKFAQSNQTPGIINNPYAKSRTVASSSKDAHTAANRAGQSLVRNPYISRDIANPQSKAIVANLAIQVKKQVPSVDPSVCSIENNINNRPHSVVYPIPTSRFFSMVDRLPSRNVSYDPAEILSVGELYRYLYHRCSDRRSSGVLDAQLPAKASDQHVYREIKSVRVTGVLLSSIYCDVDEDNPKLLDGKGQWLLLGDPLENTRCARQESTIHQDSKLSVMQTFTSNAMVHSSIVKENVTTGTTDLPKSNSFNAQTTPGGKVASVATPATLQKKPTSILKSNIMATSSRSCDFLNNKKRKFVYNKTSGRNSLSSSKGLLNAKKFQTPKRTNAILPITTTSNRRASSFSTGKKGVSVLGKVNSNRIQSPSTIIQQHPSPIVPVWNGSTRDDNALDDSVTGNLVMVVGDIVIEVCDACKIDSQDLDNSDTTGPRMKASLLPVRDVRNASRFIASLASERDGAKECCKKCIKFLRARFVTNVNGTDMNLQKEALKVRREYMKKRNEEMSSLLTDGLKSYAAGSGPFL